MNKKYSYSLTERSKEYAAKLEQSQELERQIVNMDDEISILKPRLSELESKAIELEIEAITEPKLAAQAEKANKAALEIKEKISSLEDKSKKYRLAFKRIQPLMEAERQKAIKLAQAESRKHHEQAVSEIVRAMRELSKAFEQEEKIRYAIIRDVDLTGHIIAPSPINNPGLEEDDNSRLFYAIKEWKDNGYDI